jgi:hypothetical protein
MPEVIEVHSRGTNPKANYWVCCLDCGLLMAPLVDGKVDWSICPVCSAVYKVGLEHPWIAKMLAYHVNGIPPRKKKLSLFRCAHCQNYYLRVAANKNGGPVCYWCEIKGHANARRHAGDRCLVCDRSTQKRYLATGICQDCLKNIDKVKKSLEYVYYIFGRSRTARR